ncbi:MAG: twin-arginine translocation signal domain-containing protein [Chloroflexota bacterium]|nr:twin-arginine translocation signal domain-containing protein [Chloroflexota bacterium]
MQQATRRGFLRTTSIGALAAGVVSALPTLVFAQEQAPAAPPNATSPASAPMLQAPITSSAGGASLAPFTVFVNRPTSNDAVIYIGEREIPLTNTSVIEYLRQIAASA